MPAGANGDAGERAPMVPRWREAGVGRPSRRGGAVCRDAARDRRPAGGRGWESVAGCPALRSAQGRHRASKRILAQVGGGAPSPRRVWGVRPVSRSPSPCTSRRRRGAARPGGSGLAGVLLAGFEPATLFAVPARLTNQLGLIGTTSKTYEQRPGDEQGVEPAVPWWNSCRSRRADGASYWMTCISVIFPVKGNGRRAA